MSYREIITLIYTENLDNDDLRAIFDAVKYRQTQLSQKNKSLFGVGDKVKFTGRDGTTFTGTVRKFAIKNVIVDTATGGYRVPAAMLQAA